MYEFLDIQSDGGVMVVTINRPDRRNALHHTLWDELRKAFIQINDRPPRVVVLTGAGEHFCSGMDLSPANEVFQRLQRPAANKDGMRVAEIIESLKNTMTLLSRLNCPTIAAIEGSCVGGGLELALACDLRVGSMESFFSLPETQLGMMPDLGGTVRLVRLVGRARASDVVLTGRKVTADEAWSMGLINRLAPPGDALAEAQKMAAEIVGAAPGATRQALLILRQTPGWNDDTAFTQETNAGARAIVGGEWLEGVRAFVEKRKPNW